MSAPLPRLVSARAVLADARRWIDGGSVLVTRGRVEAVLERGAARRAAATGVAIDDLGDVVLTAGLVNAHAHLELTGMRGRVARSADAPFTEWVRGVLSERARAGTERWPDDWGRGAERALATGTTLVGDVDSSGAWSASRVARRPRVRVYRELLDAFDPSRTPAALERLALAWPRRPRAWPALSPHAPHTTSDALLDAIAARARRACIGAHWSETREEVDWLERGTGPFAALLGTSPRTSGLERLASRGMLGPRTALYHGNEARAEELDRIAAAGASIVHCPGAHAWFGRAPIDLARWLARGVRVALGTDSLAGNDDLDMARELLLARRASPGLAPADAWELATQAGAAALGFAGRAGELAPGAWADLVAWRVPSFEHEAALDALTSGGARVAAVRIGGERAWSSPVAGSGWPAAW